MANIKLSPPWDTFVNELHALFDEDPEVHVEYTDGGYEVKLYVENDDKAEALHELLGDSRIFGNVVLKISVIPANVSNTAGKTLIERAFKGNPVLKLMYHYDKYGLKMDYAVFRKEVVQFYNDNLQDLHGNKSTLFEDIARDVFPNTSVCFCTDNEDKVGKPLGEWP